MVRIVMSRTGKQIRMVRLGNLSPPVEKLIFGCDLKLVIKASLTRLEERGGCVGVVCQYPGEKIYFEVNVWYSASLKMMRPKQGRPARD